jgi:predicted Zn-dependent protease with MMP-like domain
MLPAEQFEELIGDALDNLPPFFAEQMKNIVVLVEQWPSKRTMREMGLSSGQTLLGLYTGIPITERTQGYNMVLPDTITLYQGPIEQVTADWPQGTYLERVRDEVRHTVIHEIAHHFGISDDRLHQLGAY